MFRNLTLLIILSTSSISFGQDVREIMYRTYDSEWEECTYLNQKGDTLIPLGECIMCFSDSLPYAIVVKRNDQESGFQALNSQGKEVFRVFSNDNGPDYVSDGTMRIVKGGKIGYASKDGNILVTPQYEGAKPFENGRAEVTFQTRKETDGEHSWWVGGDWFFIDKDGKRIEE